MKQIRSHNYCRAYLPISGIVLLMVTLLSPSATGQTQFKKFSGNPILTAGPAGSWDADGVTSGSVMYHNSKYHMWYPGVKGSVVSIGYAFSDDGIVWTEYAGNPVLVPGATGTFDAALYGCYVLFYSGKFHMWYDGINSGNQTIGYAYSDDGINWTKHPTYVFAPGSAGSWDVQLGGVGPVVNEDTVLKMFYWGKSSTSSWMTCLATSPDSIHWTRYNSGNPVMAGGIAGAWDQSSQYPGTVIKNGGLYEMWYGNWTPSPYCIGYARSINGGLNWTTYSANPVLRGDAGAWDASWTIWPMVVQRPAGGYLMYYTGSINGAKVVQSIGLAIDSMTTLGPGSYTVGNGGYFPTLDSVFARLSTYGILGPVTLLLTDTLYDATTNVSGSFKLVGPISGAGPASRITIRPADNTAVTIQGNGDAVLLFQNVSYLTLDGVNLQGKTRLKVHALHNSARAYNEGILFTENSDFNVVQRLTACSDDNAKLAGAIGFWGNSTAGPDSCLVSDVDVTSGGIGIYVQGYASMRAKGNVIRNNHVGSPGDSLLCWGIQDQLADGTIIENNHIEHLRLSDPSNNEQTGINTYAGRNTIIRNNMVHNLCNMVDNAMVNGILSSGNSSDQRGSKVWIYNNKVWDIRNSATNGSSVIGIAAWSQDSVKVDFNTIDLVQSGDVPPINGSSAVWMGAMNVYPTLRNNILLNTRNDLSRTSTAIRIDAPTSFSDYNDLFAGSSGSANIGKMGTTLYKSLADWQSASKDIHSISTCPIFCVQGLHIDTTNLTSNALNGKGTPIAGILSDFEGALRNTATPDIGADEFDLATGFTKGDSKLPATFALQQNYPNPFNPSTIIEYQIPKQSFVTVKISDLLGREVATLVNETKHVGTHTVKWDASRLSSGVYFYTITAGTFRETKRMILMK